MDVYRSTVDYLLPFPLFNSWEEMRAILQRAGSTRPRDWALPLLACQSLGEPAEKAVPACAALACALISIILVDDMLDDDPRGEYHRIGSGRASNLAIAFQSAAIDALLRSDASSKIQFAALESLNRMLLVTAYGQESDIQSATDEVSYWRVVENKSAPFFGCAFVLGALWAEANQEIAKNLERLGRLYGEMIQIHDDLNDTMVTPANPDWLQKRRPLPILFALTVNHPDRERFIELYEDIPVGNALQEAQEILIRCGAISYCVDQLIRRYRVAHEILIQTPLANQEILNSLIGGVIGPVQKLFDTLGIPPKAWATMAELLGPG